MSFNRGDQIAIRNHWDNTVRTVTRVEGDEVHYECEWADGTVHPGRAASIDALPATPSNVIHFH